MLYDVCAVGFVTKESEVFQGAYRTFTAGPPYFLSIALKNLGSSVMVVTKIALKDKHILKDFEELGIKVIVRESKNTFTAHTVYGATLDERHIKVLAVADPFTLEDLNYCEKSKYIYVGPLTTKDFDLNFIIEAKKKAPLILDVQGFNREVVKGTIKYVDWSWKLEGSKYIDIFKADVNEAKLLTGTSDPYKAIEIISSWGPKEVIITSSKGVYLGVKNVGTFFAPFIVKEVKGRVGRGDTCLASYIHAKLKNMPYEKAVKFAAAATSLKLSYAGPLRNTEAEVLKYMESKYK